MSLWGSNSAATADKPKYLVHSSGNGEAMGDLRPKTVGIKNTDAQSNESIPHAGWNLRIVGLGPVVSVSIDAPGTGYANGEPLVFSPFGATPTANAAGFVTTDANGAVTAVTLTSGGSGYEGGNNYPDVDVTTAAGANALFTALIGGRGGRISYEVLVAGNLTGSGV